MMPSKRRWLEKGKSPGIYPCRRSKIHLTQTLSSASSSQLHDAIAQPYDLVAGMIMAVTFFVAILYCLDALYGERRDRSILFCAVIALKHKRDGDFLENHPAGILVARHTRRYWRVMAAVACLGFNETLLNERTRFSGPSAGNFDRKA